MITLAAHLYRQVMRRGRVVSLLALVSVLGVILWLTSIDGPTRATYPGIVVAGGMVVSLAVLILTVAVLRDERDSGTLPYIYMRPIERAAFAAASIGAGMLAALALAIGAWGASVLGGMAAGFGFEEMVPALALFSIAAIGYASVFVPLGYLAPRALLIGITYVVIVESIVAQEVGGVAEVSIWRIAVSVYAGVAGDLPTWVLNDYLDPLVPGVWGGLAKIGAVILVGWGVLTWALSKRDAV